MSGIKLEWRRMKKHHGHYAILWSAHGVVRRCAAIYDDRWNPLRPVGVGAGPKPFTLELYFPMPEGIERVQKFAKEADARTAAQRYLDDFTAEIVKAKNS